MCREKDMKQRYWKGYSQVLFIKKHLYVIVLTVVSGVLLARFSTVKCIPTDHVKLSSDYINCRRKKWERKLTLSPFLMLLTTNFFPFHLNIREKTPKSWKKTKYWPTNEVPSTYLLVKIYNTKVVNTFLIVFQTSF